MVQFFPKIFSYFYPFLAHLKSIFVAGTSWKVTQVKPKFTWLTFVKSEEDNPLKLVPSNISRHDHLLWGLSKHFLLLGCILVSKWGLRPNIKVQILAHYNSPSKLYFFSSDKREKLKFWAHVQMDRWSPRTRKKSQSSFDNK